jgi:hypothetical protein
MKTLVVNALVATLCDAEVAVLLRLLNEALDAGRLEGGEEYVAEALRYELSRELPVLEAGEQWCCPTKYRCRWIQKRVDSKRR